MSQITFKVKTKDSETTWNVFLDDDTSPHAGYTIPEKREVHINRNLNSFLFRKVTEHELLHAWIAIFKQQEKKWTEEDLCYFVSMHMDNIINFTNEIQRIWEETKQ